MQNVEAQAKYLKSQKLKIKKEVISVANLVMNDCLHGGCNQKYGIGFSLDDANNLIECRIWNKEKCDGIERLDIYSLENTFESYSFHFDKKILDEKVKKVMLELSAMKTMVKKYQKLNK